MTSSQEEHIYRRALESIRDQLWGMNPDSDDRDYERELAIIEIRKILKAALGPEEVEEEYDDYIVE